MESRVYVNYMYIAVSGQSSHIARPVLVCSVHVGLGNLSDQL